jgi:hypothetical protein
MAVASAAAAAAAAARALSSQRIVRSFASATQLSTLCRRTESWSSCASAVKSGRSGESRSAAAAGDVSGGLPPPPLLLEAAPSPPFAPPLPSSSMSSSPRSLATSAAKAPRRAAATRRTMGVSSSQSRWNAALSSARSRGGRDARATPQRRQAEMRAVK